MLRWIVGSSLRARGFVAVIAAALVGVGVLAAARRCRWTSLPEFAPPTVEIQTEALGLSADEVEQLITVPLEAGPAQRRGRSSTTIHSEVGARAVVDRADLRARHRPLPRAPGGRTSG